MIGAKGIFANKSILGTKGIYGAAGIATGGGAWTPASLTNLLWWYNIYDLSKMWTTSDKTTLVSADNDPVGYIEDSSGNGHDIQQTTAGNRPIFKTSGGLNWLEFNGATSNRWLQSVNTVDHSATNEVTLCGGVRFDLAGIVIVAELSANINSNNGTYALLQNAGPVIQFLNKGNAIRTTQSAATSPPITAVLVGRGKISTTSTLRVNQTETTGGSAGVGNYGNYTLYIGRRGGASLSFDGNIYSLFSYADIKSGADLTAIEEYIAEKTGVTL